MSLKESMELIDTMRYMGYIDPMTEEDKCALQNASDCIRIVRNLEQFVEEKGDQLILTFEIEQILRGEKNVKN